MLCLNLRLLRNLPQYYLNFNRIHKVHKIPEAIWGLSCKINQTVGFLRMDKRFSAYFMNLWNGKPHNLLNNSKIIEDSVALISNMDERIYWMEKESINR